MNISNSNNNQFLQFLLDKFQVSHYFIFFPNLNQIVSEALPKIYVLNIFSKRLFLSFVNHIDTINSYTSVNILLIAIICQNLEVFELFFQVCLISPIFQLKRLSYFCFTIYSKK